MIWLFENGAALLELETSYDNDTFEYLLELREPRAAPRRERFSDRKTFRDRLVAIETSLAGKHWRRIGPPIVLESGWPDRRPPK